MKRINIFQNEYKDFDVDYFSKVIASWLNEEINIEYAPEGSGCCNCFWKSIDKQKRAICKAPIHYIGMQVCDCTQYKLKEN